MTDYEHIKLEAARTVYRWHRAGLKTSKGGCWREWWESKFQDNYEAFVAEQTRIMKQGGS